MRPRLLAFACLFTQAALGSTAVALAGEPEVIFSGEGGARSGWMAAPWGGLKVYEEATGGREPGQASVRTEITNESAAYCGFSFQVVYGRDMAGEAIPLTPELREKGVVRVAINGGAGVTEETPLQMNLGLVMPDGEILRGKMRPLKDFAEFEAIDGDPATWQVVNLSVADFLAGTPGADQATGLCSVGFQYLQPPLAPIVVTDCELVESP